MRIQHACCNADDQSEPWGNSYTLTSGSLIRSGGGLVNYSAAELQRIKGIHSSAIEAVLQYKVSDEIIHRDDLVLLG